MTNEDLINLLQEDLRNERMHCLFYQQAAALVKGLHREEYRELFLKEAESELHHVDEFANLIVRLGGVPCTLVANLPTISNWSSVLALCSAAHEIEAKVAFNYAKRLWITGQVSESLEPISSEISYVNLFYEDQLKDSQEAAFEFKLLCEGNE